MIIAVLAALALSGSPNADTQHLSLPAGTPESFAITVALDGRTRRLELHRHDLRAPAARVRVYEADGTYTTIVPPPVATYRGVVDDDPLTAVVANLDGTGLTATVFPPDEEAWTIRPAGIGRARHAVGDPITSSPVSCGVAETQAPSVGAPPAVSASVSAEGPACQYICEIAFDADHEYYLLKGASVANTVAAIDAHMNLVDLFYARDMNVSYVITDYVVRTAPFYTPVSGGDLLDQFREEWNTNQAGVVRDIAHLMTDKPGAIIEYGGLAWVGVVCTNSGYGWSLDSAGIIGHEVGHNWNAPHCLDPSPCNAMCGACLNLGPVTRQVTMAHRDSRTCLDLSGPYADPLPPYASLDRGVARRHAWTTTAPLAFDVLANDGDGNCDPLAIDAHDGLSDRGAPVTLSPGTGPGGRDELVYTLPAVPFIGTDDFNYTVGDGTGEQTEGTVRMTVRSSTLAGVWPLDDGPDEVPDATGHGFDGTVVGAPQEVTGVIGNALAFDGVGDAVSIPALGLDTDQATITAWVRRSGPQASFAGLVFCRGGSTVAGLSCGAANELRYHWNNDGATYNFNSGLVLPHDQWAFVALVVEPDRATFYLHDGLTMQTAVNPIVHDVEAFDAPTLLGHDVGSAARHFAGRLDDVRIFDYALDAAVIDLLAAGLGRAAAPMPPDGGRLAIPGDDLTWLAGPGAASHDVYLGTDYVTVRDATTASPAYLGNTSEARHGSGILAPDVTHFWRVDAVSGASVVPGHVWQFTPKRARWWPLDEAAGPTVDDAYGDDDGTMIAGPVPGQPAATPALGTAVFLDGVNDRIELPPLDLESDAVTMSAWIRRDGPQVDVAGLVFNRAGSSVAGLNLGADEDLRYHWNDQHWGWASGLEVPDGQWVFVALVVEPDRGTLYLGQDGVLTAAVNAGGHAVEAFDGPTHLGQGGPGYRYFRGDIDDVRIHDASLTASQIETLFRSAAFCDPAADTNCDGAVDVDDLVTVIVGWGSCAGTWPCIGDVNGDGVVNVDDLVMVIVGWSG